MVIFFKMDFGKAYKQVEWNFLKKVEELVELSSLLGLLEY